jgi:hypothetical protein
MLLKSLNVSSGIRVAAVLFSAFLFCVFPIDGAAQSKQRLSKRSALPRVGTIKDYPATGLMAGCANLYFYPAIRSSSSPTAYVFLASGDGSNAWMNLGGRDRRLQQVRLLARENGKQRRYEYRLGSLRVSVVIENFKPESELMNESDPMFKMKITLRRGRAVRIVRAVGDSDC